MANILFLYERDMATVSEAQLCYERVFKGCGVFISFKRIYKIKSADIAWADILYFIRPDNTLSLEVARKVACVGKMVIFFIDDDLFHLPMSMPTIPWRRKALEEILSVSDLIISSSPHICDMYKNNTKGKRAVRLDTPVAQEEIVKSSSVIDIKENEIEGREIKIVFAAGRNHEAPFDDFIQPILPKLNKRYGNKVSFTFVGVHPSINSEDYNFNLDFLDGMSLCEYRKFMREKKFDIGLSPLHQDEFTKCKYFNKYIEYTMMGIAGIFSECEPYTYVVRSGENGLLVRNDPESWYDALCCVIDNKKLRIDFTRSALNDIKENFSDIAIRSHLEREIPEMLEISKDDSRHYVVFSSLIKYRLLRICDIVYLIWYYLRKNGIKEVVYRIKEHIRASKSYK